MIQAKKAVRVVAVVAVLVLLAAGAAWWALFRKLPQSLADDSIEEYYKYGSIGTEDANGMPFWIWLVLPKMFPEYLPAPGGYAALGFVWEQGREMPVGFSKKTIGFERVGINCALCHSATFRRPGEVVSRVVLGGPAVTQDILSYQRFLSDAASDPRFTAGNVLREIAAVTDLPLSQRLLYRFVLVPQTRKALLKQKEAFAWCDSRPAWGRGRISPLNPVKLSLLEIEIGDTHEPSDMEPLWNLRPRAAGGGGFHWDGLNPDLTEVVLASALGNGASMDSLPLAELERIQEYISDLPVPRFEEWFTVDAELAAAGGPVYRAWCAECHAPGGKWTGTVLALDDPIWQDGSGDSRTDPQRALVFGQQAADTFNRVTQGYPWALHHYRSTGGYVSVPLDGIWLRAPYLHNGSVPYLDDLLERPEDRTPVFYRGYDLYDPERMGFVSEGAEAEQQGTRYDVSLLGNSNGGHLWGTELAPDEKRALIEYLKTL